MRSRTRQRRRRGLYAGGFTPAQLSGLVLWLTPSPAYCFTDAGGTVAAGDGDAVQVWKDRGGNAYDFSQSTSGARPTLRLVSGKWCVLFDGVDDQLTSASGPASVRCWFAAVDRLSTTGEFSGISTVLAKAGADAGNVRTNSATKYRARDSAGTLLDSADNSDHSVLGASGWGFRINGAADTNTYAVATAHTVMSISGSDGTGDYSAGVRLACIGGGTTRLFNGRYYELFGTSALPADFAVVQAYLAGRMP